ncbi:hypothetical protein F4823DRAFT_248445 [Ustulina deusta]|nr:hypothetical protein F4823DRAFT_248445 [Ustulina deusta]
MLRVVCRRQPKQFDPVTPGALRDVKIPMYVMFYDRFSNKIMYFISYACADMLSRRFALRVSRSDKRSNFLPSLTYSQALKCLSIPSSPTSPQNLPSRPSIKTASVHQDPSRIESKRTLDFIAPKTKTIHHPPHVQYTGIDETRHRSSKCLIDQTPLSSRPREPRLSRRNHPSPPAAIAASPAAPHRLRPRDPTRDSCVD